MEWLRRQLSKELWSPYAAGALLGVVGILTVALSNSLLGASGGFENLAGLVGKAIAPTAFNNVYFNFVMPPGGTLPGVPVRGGVLGRAGGGASGWRGGWTRLPPRLPSTMCTSTSSCRRGSPGR